MRIANDELEKREYMIKEIENFTNIINQHKENPRRTLSYLYGLYAMEGSDKTKQILDIQKGLTVHHLKEVTMAKYTALLKEISLSNLVSVERLTIIDISNSIKKLFLKIKEDIIYKNKLFNSEQIVSNLKLIESRKLYRLMLGERFLKTLKEMSDSENTNKVDYLRYLLTDLTFPFTRDDSEDIEEEREYIIRDYDYESDRITYYMEILMDSPNEAIEKFTLHLDLSTEVNIPHISTTRCSSNYDVNNEFSKDNPLEYYVESFLKVVKKLNRMDVDITERVDHTELTLSKLNNYIDTDALTKMLGTLTNQYVESKITKDEHKLRCTAFINLLKKAFNIDKKIVRLLSGEINLILDESEKYESLFILFSRVMSEGTSIMCNEEIRRELEREQDGR